jgi:hypothetical protein
VFVVYGFAFWGFGLQCKKKSRPKRHVMNSLSTSQARDAVEESSIAALRQTRKCVLSFAVVVFYKPFSRKIILDAHRRPREPE